MIPKYFTPPKEAVKVFPDGREVCSNTIAGSREYQLRLTEMYERQGQMCAIHAGWITREEATFDHQAGRGSGGGHRDDRTEVRGQWQNAALCIHCNGAKGSRRYHWLAGEYVPV